MNKFRLKKAGFALLFLGIFFSLLNECNTVPCEDTDWPMFMHDLHNTGYSPSAAPDSLHLVWEFDTEKRLFGSPVVHAGVLYQVGRGTLFALDAETGTLLWSSILPVVGSTPFVTDKSLYVGTCNGVAAVNSKTGEIIWQVQLADLPSNPENENPAIFLASSPLVTDTGVIMCTRENWELTFTDPPREIPEGTDRAVCLDSETGALVWEYSLDFSAGYSPALVDGKIIINSLDLEVLDHETGQELWSYPDLWLFETSPVVSGNTLITITKDTGTIFVFDLTTHELLWEHCLDTIVNSTPAVHDRKIVVVVRTGMICALDKTTGDIVWKKEFPDDSDIPASEVLKNAAANFSSSPAIADNKIYAGLWSGAFLCLRLDTGETLWQYTTGGSIVASPAVADEKVFIASTDGKVYCFGIDPETYFAKAEEYREQGNTERAREFYMRARDYYEIRGNQEMVTKCERQLEDRHYKSEILVVICIILVGTLLIFWKKLR